jgi:hypothetical protein
MEFKFEGPDKDSRDYESFAKEARRMQFQAALQLAKLCHMKFSGGTDIRCPIIYDTKTEGGGATIDIKPGEYEIVDAPKELPGVKNAITSGTDKKS